MCPPSSEPATPEAAQHQPAPGQVVTVFRNRLRPEAMSAYHDELDEVAELAASMPGFLESKTFTAQDGERATIVTFADESSHQAWRDHPRHQRAQRHGVQHYYSMYSIAVGVTDYASHFVRQDEPAPSVRATESDGAASVDQPHSDRGRPS